MSLKKAGETIVEVMIAFAIIATVVTSILVLFQRTLSLQTNVRNQSVALYLAQEGLEAVRHIRDTNYLVFPDNKRTHWLHGFDQANQYYELDYDLDLGRYIVTPSAMQSPLLFTREDLEGRPGAYQDLQLYQSTSDDFTLWTLQSQDRSGADNTPTRFYRQMKLEIINPYDLLVDEGTIAALPTFCDGDDPECDQAAAIITARVGWIENKSMRQVELQTHLFDHLDRTSY